MTHYIGDVPVSSIQEVTISKGEETDEIDLIGEDTNIILSGSDEGKEIEIEFTLLEQTHPERLNVEKQRSETKELISNDASDNYFHYDKKEYFLSVENVSVPEDGSLENIREGTITSKALPYPKHFTDARTGVNKLNSGEVNYVLFVNGNLFTVTSFIDGELEYSLVLDEEVNKLITSESLLEYNFNIDSKSNKEISERANVDYEFIFEDVIADMKWSSVGCLQFILELLANSNKIISVLGDSKYSLDFEGELDENLAGPFGKTFGRRFGGT